MNQICTPDISIEFSLTDIDKLLINKPYNTDVLDRVRYILRYIVNNKLNNTFNTFPVVEFR